MISTVSKLSVPSRFWTSKCKIHKSSQIFFQEEFSSPQCSDPRKSLPKVLSGDITPSESLAKNLMMGKIDPKIFRTFEFDLDRKFPGIAGKCRDYRKAFAARENLKSLKCFSLRDRNKRNAAEFSAILEEIRTDLELSELIAAANTYAVSGIELFGTDIAKQKYLPDLRGGNKSGSVCIADEFCGSDISQTKTFLTKNEKSSDTFKLNGTKTWVSNGRGSDILTVFANFTEEDSSRINQTYNKKMTALVVDKTMEGISVGTNMNSVGLKGLNCCRIHFEDVIVPRAHILGDIGQGYEVYAKMMLTDRVFTGARVVSVLKAILNDVIKRVSNLPDDSKSDFSQRGHSLPLMSEMAKVIYTLESVTYMTALMYDNNEDSSNEEFEMESALVKLYALKASKIVMDNAFTLLGSHAFKESNPLFDLFKDLESFESWEGSRDMLSMYVGLEGYTHVGKMKADLVFKWRNPNTYPMASLKKLVHKERIVNRPNWNLGCPLKLHNHLEPELKQASTKLESYLQKFSFSTDFALFTCGQDIVLREGFLNDLAWTTAELYGFVANIARANSSLKLKQDSSGFGVDLANLSAIETGHLINDHLYICDHGWYDNADLANNRVCDYMLDFGNYCAWHPMRRTKF